MKSGVENYLVKKSSNNIWTVPDISLNQTSDPTSAIINDTGGAIIAGFGSPNYPFRLKDTICSPLYINGASTVGLSAIAIDQNNHYWTNGTNYNLFEYDGTLIQHSSPTSSPIKFIVVDSSNNKWVYFYNGKLYLYNGTFSTMYDSGNTGLNLDSLSNLIADPYSNAIWLCSEDGFLKLENGAWSTIDTSNSPIPTNDAEYIYFNSDSSILFGCRGGSAYLKNGIWEIYTVYNSLLCNNDVEGITVDQNCRMWLTTENGVSSAMLECGILNINLVSGKVTTPNNIPAQNLLMKLFKLDYTKNEIFQIENTFTDTFGNYSFELQDSGTYYVLAQTGNNSYNDFIPTYNNNESLIQLSSPFYYSSDGNIIKDIILNSKNEIIGICSISGRFTSSNSNIVLGNRIAFLVKNNQIIDSKITDIYGGFSFKNIPQGIYQIWLDKYGLSNFKSNNINVDCNNLNSYIFNIDSNGISGTPTSVNTQVNENDLLVFPNPNFGILNILYKNNTDSKFQILNIQGQIIYEIKLPKESQNKMINIEHTAKGVYFYKQICNNEFIKNGKLLIE
jgi:hypothetical protein